MFPIYRRILDHSIFVSFFGTEVDHTHPYCEFMLTHSDICTRIYTHADITQSEFRSHSIPGVLLTN